MVRTTPAAPEPSSVPPALGGSFLDTSTLQAVLKPSLDELIRSALPRRCVVVVLPIVSHPWKVVGQREGFRHSPVVESRGSGCQEEVPTNLFDMGIGL